MKALWIILISCITSACVVSYSFRGGDILGENFSIESFDFGPSLSIVNPDLPIILQDALQQKFTNESNLKYSTTKSDVNFKGTITGYTITPVQGTGDQTVSLNRLTISLNVLYFNENDTAISIDGKVLNVASYDDFESSADFNTEEPILVESISEKLVSLIYNQVLVNW